MTSALHHIQARSSLMEGAITIFCFSLFFFCSHALVSPGSTAVDDELALLSFKSMLSAGSSKGLLVSWNSSSRYCSWPGVICGRRHPERVIALRMRSANLSGRISPSLGNLSFLRELDLGNNHLTGQIPLELGHLAKLRVLNLSMNSLQGSIPVDLGGCSNLITLDLSRNQLRGEIPTEIGTSMKSLVSIDFFQNVLSGQIPGSLGELPSIKILYLDQNKISGEIPPGLGNLSNLQSLSLTYNTLTGAIPSSFGMLPRLSQLLLGNNNLSGVIPTSIWNISSLTLLSVQQNMLSGTIPPNAFNTLPHLRRIFMDSNQFHGHIPASIANASNILTLQLPYNFFSGIVPPEVGRLRNLNWLEVGINFLQAKKPHSWEFVTALTNCSKLQVLRLSTNKFEGAIPDSLSNLSTSLFALSLGENKISGSIPKDIGNLINLEHLLLYHNSFTGTLPSSLGQLKKLGEFDIFKNKISGSIPWTIGNLTELNYLHLSRNAFSGRLPTTLGNLTKLLTLDLAGNNFTGPIPVELLNIPTLSMMLDLSNNNLEGSIPQEIGRLKNLVAFYAESNKLSGEIPSAIGGCQVLQHLCLQNNTLIGNIPSALSQLKGLETLDLSRNNLSGHIPKYLGDLATLHYLNLSFNSFVGAVPNVGVFANSTAISIQGNGKLCGGIPALHLPPCSLQSAKKKHKFLVVPMLVSLISTLAGLALLYKLLTWHKKSKAKIASTTSMQGHPVISYSQLVKATDGFSTSNLLGSGSFGSVYKGQLDAHAVGTTNVVAVKVLKLQTPKAHKSFIAECEALRNMRHRNLIKIITVCSSIDTRGDDFRAIVYDFMPNGSLEVWLHPYTNDQAEEKHLNLHQRVTILLDVAYALDYLHCHGPAPVVHCDVKSGNVLLDADMVAHVGDFGLARILVEGSSILQQSMSSMGFRGTIVMLPQLCYDTEYGAGNTMSTHGDIYSYGILVLETVTGKRPTESQSRQGLSLREYAELGLCDRMMDVVDMRLSSDLEDGLQTVSASAYKTTIDCLGSLLRLGMSCSQALPSSRMTTGDIIKELHAIKESLLRENII